MTLSLSASQPLSALIQTLPESPDQLSLEQWDALRQALTGLLPHDSLTLPPADPYSGIYPATGQAPWESEEKSRIILSSIGDAVITTNRLGNVTYLNPVAEWLTRWTSAEAFGHPVEKILTIINDQTGCPADNPVGKVLQTGLVWGLDEHTSLVSRTGQIIPIEDSAAPIESPNGETLGVVMIFRDVSEKRRKEDELRRLNRTLKALSASSQAMMRATDESAYLNEVCRIITQDCGHAMVWIGFAQNDPIRSVHPVAYAGFETGYLETLNITWADSERGRGPTGTAIRTGQPTICRNMLTDPKFAPWRGEALKRGYAASISLPLKNDGQSFGGLTIYSRQADPFSVDEIHLLNELASDLAYGITALRLRNAHAAAEGALRESEIRYRGLFSGMPDGLALYQIVQDEHGEPSEYRFLEVNAGFERLTGIKPDDVKGKLRSEIAFFQQRDPIIWVGNLRKVAQTGQPVHFEIRDAGLQKIIEFYVFRPDPTQIAVLSMDITERRRMEESIAQSAAHVEMQRRLIDQREQERLQIARDLHDGPMQELAASLFTLQCAIQDAPDESYRGMLEHLRGELQHQLQELRDFACELRPPTLTRFGLNTAIKSHVDMFCGKHPEIEVRLRLMPVDAHLPEQVQVALFRIYQQAMNNITRHSRANLVEIWLKRSKGQAVMEVQDNGVGFDVPKDWLELAKQKHLGIVGMRERAEAVCGQLTIQSKPGKGTRLTVTVPLV